MSGCWTMARARKVYVCMHAYKHLYIFLFNWHSLSSARIDDICLKFWIPISGACATAKARWVGVRACTQGGWKVGGGVTAQPKLPCGWFLIIFPFFTLSLGPLEAEIYVFSDGLSENEWKRLKECAHKLWRQTLNMLCRHKIFFDYCQRVPGACSGPKWPTLAHLEHPEKVLSFKKEAERGWKSGARSLSWKSDWKPSISRSFCAIGTYCIFFRLEVTAVWKKSAGINKSPLLNLCFC